MEEDGKAFFSKKECNPSNKSLSPCTYIYAHHESPGNLLNFANFGQQLKAPPGSLVRVLVLLCPPFHMGKTGSKDNNRNK